MSNAFYIQKGVLIKYTGSDSDVIIPDSVIKIGKNAFLGCSTLNSVVIPNSVIKIGNQAFSGCSSLSSVTIPGSVFEIGSGAFLGCKGLTTVEINKGVLSIKNNAFTGCISLVSITIPDSVIVIESTAFSGCSSLKSIFIPESVSQIGIGVFLDCVGLESVILPRKIDKIRSDFFRNCKNMSSVTMTDSVTEIGPRAFEGCINLASIKIPDSVTEIGPRAFKDCINMVSVTMRYGINRIGNESFSHCERLSSVTIPESVTEISSHAFYNCKSLKTIFIPSNVKRIEYGAFAGCDDLVSILLAKGVKSIGEYAFSDCVSLRSVVVPCGVDVIHSGAFAECRKLSSISLPERGLEIERNAFQSSLYYNNAQNWENGALYIGHHLIEVKENISDKFVVKTGTLSIADWAFATCNSFVIKIPDSVIKFGMNIFGNGNRHMIVCGEESYAHNYCNEIRQPFVFDYQYEVFHGVFPPIYEKLDSPFPADEEKPYVFISYSHKDRNRVLKIIKSLYESGWKIWYDEGLTIGEKYDETIERHVKNCSVFLLFLSENSHKSKYIIDNEYPWAMKYCKPIIICNLDEAICFEVEGGLISATVTPHDIEPSLKMVPNIKKGENRVAKGISVIYIPIERDLSYIGFAYCLYSHESSAIAQTVILEARKSGCIIYDATKNGESVERLQSSASLIVFLDKAFLLDMHLIEILETEYRKGSDLIICQTENIESSFFCEGLSGLDKLHFLRFDFGITSDIIMHLARHLQNRGCRNTLVLPGFNYINTIDGIIITEYIGTNTSVVIEREYGGIPVIRIEENAFENCISLKKVEIPNSVKSIGKCAFKGCTNITSVIINEGVEEIGDEAFSGCESLLSVSIPNSVIKIGDGVFWGCKKLADEDGFVIQRKVLFSYYGDDKIVGIPICVTKIAERAFKNCNTMISVIIPETVTEIGSGAFLNCENLTEVCIPNSVTEIKEYAFGKCSKLKSVIIPDTVTRIGFSAFCYCTSLISLKIPKSIQTIEDNTFEGCINLKSIYIPSSVSYISEDVFEECQYLTIIGEKGSVAYRYAANNYFRFFEIEDD